MNYTLPLFGKIQNLSSQGTQYLSILSYDIESRSNMAYVINLNDFFKAPTQYSRENSVQSQSFDEKCLFVLSNKQDTYLITESAIYRRKLTERESFISFASLQGEVQFAQLLQKCLVSIQTRNGIDYLTSISLSEGKILHTLELRESVTALAISDDQKNIAIGYESGLVELFKQDEDELRAASIKEAEGQDRNPIQMHQNVVTGVGHEQGGVGDPAHRGGFRGLPYVL